jgi:hypothetical protein
MIYSGCGRVVKGAGHKAKRLVLYNHKMTLSMSAQRSNSKTVWFNWLKDLILTLFGLIFRRI